MSPRVALSIMIGLTVVVVLYRLFQVNWVVGVTGGVVMFGTGFIWAGQHLADRDDTPQTQQSAAKIRAIGLIVIGIGALFGALMYLT